MEAHVRELLDLVFRWVHLIAGIMWIGNSLLFNWLDRNLVMPDNPKEGLEGEIWLLHSGGFYQVEKKQLAPSQLPRELHWFKWQNGATWMSGILLLGVVYYMGGGAYLVDPSVSSISVHAAMAIGVGAVVASWVVYDLLWRSPLGKHSYISAPLCFAGLIGVSFLLSRFLSGRAAFMHVGVLMGTLMTGNVWMVILPSQRELVAATKEGRNQDKAIAWKAKQRSIHNNYMTFPLLFIMVSNHFPSTYGSKLNWLILAVIMVTGALVRHFMNIRFTFARWLPSLSFTVMIGILALYVLTARPSAPPKPVASLSADEIIHFKTARGVIKQRCVQCHSASPTDDVWKVAPVGVMLDSPEQMRTMAPRIKDRVQMSRTMPLGNKTQITDAERELLGAWVDQGARIDD